jgi:hypothetical protein
LRRAGGRGVRRYTVGDAAEVMRRAIAERDPSSGKEFLIP